MIQYRAKGVTVFQSALYETTSTIIETPSFILVTDPCLLPHEIEKIHSYVENIRNSRPLYVLFTHSDWDHIIGSEAFTNATRIASREFTHLPNKAEIVNDAIHFDQKYYLERNYKIQFPTIDIAIDKDGQELRVGETCLTFYQAFGHTACGLFCIVEPAGVFLSGDYLSNIEFPFMYYSSMEYERTVKKVEEILNRHQINLLVPGHGQCTTHVKEILFRKNQSLDYIHQLRQHIQNKDQAAIDGMLQFFPSKYSEGMKSCHEDNQQICTQELNLSE